MRGRGVSDVGNGRCAAPDGGRSHGDFAFMQRKRRLDYQWPLPLSSFAPSAIGIRPHGPLIEIRACEGRNDHQGMQSHRVGESGALRSLKSTPGSGSDRTAEEEGPSAKNPRQNHINYQRILSKKRSIASAVDDNQIGDGILAAVSDRRNRSDDISILGALIPFVVICVSIGLSDYYNIK